MIRFIRKKTIKAFFAIFVGFILVYANVNQAFANNHITEQFTGDEKKEIIQIFQKFFLENPEIIREALIALEQKNELKRAAEIKDIIASQKKIIENPSGLFITGNSDADVTLVVFFDYNAEWSKRAFADLLYLLENDKKLKIVFYEAPMREQSSYTAAKAALAAAQQNKYLSLHSAFMAHPESLDDESIFRIAEEVGLNIAQLKKDMDEPEVDKAIENSLNVAEILGISGTPAYIIGNDLYLGAQGIENLRARIAEIRINQVQ